MRVDIDDAAPGHDRTKLVVVDGPTVKRVLSVRVTCVCPPIPDRSKDWSAVDDDTYDGPGSPIGEGATMEEAIADLVEQLDAR